MTRTHADIQAEAKAAYFCWDTLNAAEVSKLQSWVCPPHLHISSHAGMGCAGDPPGYPTYFLRAVYTEQGDHPERGPSQVIVHPVLGTRLVPELWRSGLTWEAAYAEHAQLMLRLWNPLPVDHPRTRAWLRHRFVYHRHCYHAPGHHGGLGVWPSGNTWSDTMLIWPGGCLGSTPFGKLRKVGYEVQYAKEYKGYDGWTADAQAAFEAEILAENDRITALCREVAVVDNMDAVLLVRRWYPEFVPEPWLLAEDLRYGGDWWERRERPPKAGSCPGDFGQSHPLNSTWCQFCGWYAEGKMAKEDVYANV